MAATITSSEQFRLYEAARDLRRARMASLLLSAQSVGALVTITLSMGGGVAARHAHIVGIGETEVVLAEHDYRTGSASEYTSRTALAYIAEVVVSIEWDARS